MGEFVVAGSDRAGVFQPVEEAFDFVAALVLLFVVGGWVEPVKTRWDHRLLVGTSQHRADDIAVIGAISIDGPDFFSSKHFGERFPRHRGIACLAYTQDQSKDLLLVDGHGVDLHAQAATGSSKSLRPLFLRAPAAC